MAYDELLVDRVRAALAGLDVAEQTMFGGICFMVNEKMCICVNGEGLMCRVGAAIAADAAERNGCRPMMSGKRLLKDFVFVTEAVVRNAREFNYWIKLCLAYNPLANSSRKKK